MRKKDLNVGDLVKVMQVTKENNVAGWVPEMQNFVGKTYIIQQNNDSFIGLPYDGWYDNVLYFDVRDVRRIRKAKPVIPVAPEAAVKAEKVAKIENTLLDELIVKCMADGGIGLCSFAIQNRSNEQVFFVNAPCHARLSYSIEGKPVLVANAMYDYRRLSAYPEAYTAYIKYIVQESPWSTIINEKDVEAILSSGCTLRTDVPLNNVLGACVALREGNEFPDYLPIFQDILNAGFSGHTAYVISRGFKGKLDNPVFIDISNAHKVLSPELDPDGLAKFFIKGYDNGNKRSYFNGDTAFGIARYIAKELVYDSISSLLKKASKITVVKGPFGNENKLTYTKEGILEVCQMFENMLNKWRAE